MEKATMPNHTKKQQNVFAQSDEDTLSHIVGKQPSPNYLRHCGKSHTDKRQMAPRLEPSDSAQLTTPIPSTHMKETQPSEDSRRQYIMSQQCRMDKQALQQFITHISPVVMFSALGYTQAWAMPPCHTLVASWRVSTFVPDSPWMSEAW